jgi:hypothetical protein
MKDLVPFKYFERNGSSFCPKCGVHVESAGVVRRRLCRGGFRRLWTCPRQEHFHRGCDSCKGRWLEATYECTSGESMITLRILMGALAVKNPDMTEEQVVSAWRESVVRGIQEA